MSVSRPTIHHLCFGIMLFCIGCFASGCLGIESYTSRYLQLSVTNLRDVKYLKVELAYCSGNKAEGGVLHRERAVEVPLGQELFLLPFQKSGQAEILFTAYSSPKKEKVVSYFRQKLTLEAEKRKLPLFPLLQAKEEVPLHPLCETPKPKKPPPRRPEPRPIPRLPTGVFVGSRGGTQGGFHLPGGQIFVPGEREPTSPFDTYDRLELGKPIELEFPTWGVAHFGRYAIVTHSWIVRRENEQFTTPTTRERLSVIDIESGKVMPKRIELAEGCAPRGVDTNGKYVVVTCWGSDHVLIFWGKDFFSKEAKTILPFKKLSVERLPIDIRIHHNYAVVVHGAAMEFAPSANAAIIRLDGDKTAVVSSFPVGEAPRAVAGNNGRFYIINSGSGKVSNFYVDKDLKAQASADDITLYKGISHIAMNGWYQVIANISGRLTIRNLRSGSRRNLPLAGASLQGVCVISHTALVSDDKNNKIYVIDLKTNTVVQELQMPFSVFRIIHAGEHILMTSFDRKQLIRATFRSRRGGIKLRMQTIVEKVMVHNGKAWFYDKAAGHVRSITVNGQKQGGEEDLIKGVGPWMTHRKGLLFHNLQSRVQWNETDAKTLIVRSLDQPQKILQKLVFSQPIRAGRVFDSVALLLNWPSDSSSFGARYLTIVDLSDTKQEYWNYKSQLLEVLKQPVDVLLWDSYVIIADQMTRELYVLGEEKTAEQKNIKGFSERKLIRKFGISLPNSPLRMERIGNKLAVLLDNQSLLMLDPFAKEFKHQPIHLGGRLGAIRVHGKDLLISDRTNDSVLLFDPVGRRLKQRFPVSCDPNAFGVWEQKLVVSNYCDESLSIISLP
mgnify:CR=1 FL=1